MASLLRHGEAGRSEGPFLTDDRDLVSDGFQNLGAYAGNVEQIVDGAERAILVAVVNDGLGLCGTDTRQ